jgi:hypothetical protein
VFAITDVPVISLIAPDGGEIWDIGTVQTMAWNSNHVANVKIELSRDGGATFETLVASQPSSPSFHEWTVTGPATTQALVRLSSVENPSVSDISSTPFTIQPSLVITSPIFSSPSATLGETVVLTVQVEHDAGFPLGWPVTIQAVISYSDERIHATLARDRETQTIQTSGAGTLTFTFPLTVEEDSWGGQITGTVAFLPTTQGGVTPLIACDHCGDECTVVTAVFEDFFFDPATLGPGQAEVRNLYVRVWYWSHAGGRLSVTIRKGTIPSCATAEEISPVRQTLPIFPTGPGGDIVAFVFGVYVSNNCQTHSQLTYRGEIDLSEPGLPFLPSSVYGVGGAVLQLQAPPPPMVNLRATVLNPPVSGDGNAVISGQQFTLQIEAINPNTNQRDSNYNRDVAVILLDPTAIPGEMPQTAQPGDGLIRLNQGLGTIQMLIRVVPGTTSSRLVMLHGANANDTNVLINVWFSVSMDIERWKDCDFTSCPNLGSYFCTTACETGGFSQPTAFVALTTRATEVCDRAVLIRNRDSGTTQATTVQDVGPRTNDPYWNTGTIPVLGGCVSDRLADNLGVPNGCRGTTPFGRASVLWRFQ